MPVEREALGGRSRNQRDRARKKKAALLMGLGQVVPFWREEPL